MARGPPYRSQCRIYSDILRAILQADRAKVTYLLHEANLSYERLTYHLVRMKKIGLIENNKEDCSIIEITAKGRKYLAEFRKFEEFCETFGITV